MKRITAVAFFLTLASILSANTAFSQSREVRVTVPFNFTVGSRVLPAGSYSITTVSESLIEIQNRKTHTATLALVFAEGSQSKNGPELVFDRHGDRYFLRNILCESAAINVRLHPTEAEISGMEEASLPNNDGQVLFKAK